MQVPTVHDPIPLLESIFLSLHKLSLFSLLIMIRDCYAAPIARLIFNTSETVSFIFLSSFIPTLLGLQALKPSIPSQLPI